MISALLLTSLLHPFGFGVHPMECHFRAIQHGDTPVAVILAPLPSLKDAPGNFRVEMIVNGSLKLSAHAQPIATTPGRDVMVRGVAERAIFYTIGIDDEGHAALSVTMTEPDGAPPRRVTRVGTCQNHRLFIDRLVPA